MAIDLKEVLAIITSGRWFGPISFFTANLATGKAGEIITLRECRIARRQTLSKRNIAVAASSGRTKEANHNLNFTVNVELKNKKIRKLHPVLVFNINNQAVL